MTYQNAISRRASTDVARAPRDNRIATILFVLLALVFAPVVGLHIALAAFGTGEVAASATAGDDNLAQRPGPSVTALHG